MKLKKNNPGFGNQIQFIRPHIFPAVLLTSQRKQKTFLGETMAKLSIVYGVIFILMGLISYFGISSESVTALIPAFLGVPILLLGWVALNEKYLKHSMHASAVLMLLGFAGTVGGLIKFFRMLGGEEFERSSAITVQAIMAILCLVFLILAVKSFVDARRKKIE